MSSARPTLSVALPVYEPNPAYFRKALTSVLEQRIDGMQIAVLDDASPTCDVQALVDEIAPDAGIQVHRAPRNQGLAGNWNECIRVARGEVVHILHQDDWIADGFYRRMLPAFAAHPNIGMAFCRHAIVEHPDRVVRISHRERWRAGVLHNWLDKISERQRIQCPSVLVRRSVYETLGGFRADLCYALDWEMWVRIAARFDVWYEPKKLAFYRRHEQSETHRLTSDSEVNRDVLRAIELFAETLPPETRTQLANAAYAQVAGRALKQLARKGVDAQFPEQIAVIDEAISRIDAPSVTTRLQRQARQLKRVHLLAALRQRNQPIKKVPLLPGAWPNPPPPLFRREELPEEIVTEHDRVEYIEPISIWHITGAEYGGLGLLRRDDDVYAPPECFPRYLAPMARDSLRTTGGDVWHGALFEKTRKQIVVDEPVLIPFHANLIYGHFLLEMLPRLLLIDEWDATGAPLALSTRSPPWVREVVATLAPRRRIIWFDSRQQALAAPAFLLPSSMRSMHHDHLHPEVKAQVDKFKARLGIAEESPRTRRLYLSRSRQQNGWHSLRGEIEIEDIFRDHGFEIVHPQEKSFAEQVRLYDQAKVIAGEYSSALHNSLFARPSCKVFSINWINPYQSRICALMNQQITYLQPANNGFLDWRARTQHLQQITVDIGKLVKVLQGFLS